MLIDEPNLEAVFPKESAEPNPWDRLVVLGVCLQIGEENEERWGDPEDTAPRRESHSAETRLRSRACTDFLAFLTYLAIIAPHYDTFGAELVGEVLWRGGGKNWGSEYPQSLSCNQPRKKWRPESECKGG